ncbi:hypothetical protein SISSUDRAFT_445248 [Sistotremastrum suecicum HHB10207 ss-3]|uniref:Uncharacterized protein n=1 Tax=Sistotremastrum suecicum HHB10207 ss-3 TaxID=1314776 RepID=A0A165YBV2_9AGAM|nr:hypothetical protein SISSUDRAFT_445248 [Sistotremastrum suecicum HHB10207 ss-3]
MAAPEYPSAPGSWKNLGSAYWFLFPPTRPDTPLLDGAYHPLEGAFSATKTGQFKGGLGSVQVVRYTDTPVGPYDELIYIPGEFDNPVNGMSGLRITRIYVSTEASIYNGRRNWNVPKHLARFEFTSSPTGTLDIRVFSPSVSTSAPFFSATVQPVRFVPSFPLSTSYMPSTPLIQPPLPEASAFPSSLLEEGEEAAALIGTDNWWSIDPVIKGKVRLIWVQPNLAPRAGGGKSVKVLGDGEGFPSVQPWTIGLEWLDGGEKESMTVTSSACGAR